MVRRRQRERSVFEVVLPECPQAVAGLVAQDPDDLIQDLDDALRNVDWAGRFS